MHANNHSPAVTAVAEVDHGSDAASTTARQSASTAKRFWSSCGDQWSALRDKTTCITGMTYLVHPEVSVAAKIK
jgi:hypothetical protein